MHSIPDEMTVSALDSFFLKATMKLGLGLGAVVAARIVASVMNDGYRLRPAQDLI
jgi:hypothetical protein